MPTPTPLSDAITALHEHDDAATYQRLLDIFLQSRLGIIARTNPMAPLGVVMESDGSLTCSLIELPDGRSMVLACADRAVFVTRFDRPFNAEVDAVAVMHIALTNPACDGILINGATSENSAIIDRATIEQLLARVLARKPWWKFW